MADAVAEPPAETARAAPEDVPREPPPGLPARMRARSGLLGAGALLLIVIAAAVWYHAAGRVTTDDAQIDGHVSPLAPKVAGTVSAVYAADNQVVAAGDVLVRIDARDYETAVARARAEVADAEAAALAAHAAAAMTATTTEAGVAAARGEIGTAQARVSTARARVEEAQAEEARASRDLERMRALVEKDEVSRQEYDQALAAAAAARARREAAESAVRESAKGVDTAGASLQRARAGPDEVRVARAQASAADARVQRARAALAQAQLDHEYTELKAPVSGVVSHRSAEVGQVVQPGQPLLAIVPLEDIWVTANFKETQLAKVRAGQSVRIAVDAYGGREYRGRVDSIAAATGARFSLLPAENASGNFVKVVQRVPVKIVFDKGQDAEHLLRPGMSVKPTILVRGR